MRVLTEDSESHFFDVRDQTHVTPIDIPNPWIRPAPTIEKHVYACSGYSEMRPFQRKKIRTDKGFQSDQIFEVAPFWAHIKNLSVIGSNILVDQKYLLAGASGARARHLVRNRALVDEDKLLAKRGATAPNPIFDERRRGVKSDIPIVLDCRTKINFFHFMIETLASLCMIVDAPFDGPIFVHAWDGHRKTFADQFVDVFFPKDKDRIQFRGPEDPSEYDEALYLFDPRQMFYLANGGIFEANDLSILPEKLRKKINPSPSGRRIVRQNTRSITLTALRRHGLGVVDDVKGDFPKRVIMGRKPGASRKRRTVGMDVLVEQLQELDFETLYFEDLSPQDQIRAAQSAEILVGEHGAGFTNLIFAQEDALWIELANVDSLGYRWSNFSELAHAAGAQFHKILADCAGDPLQKESEELRAVHLSDKAIEKTMSLIFDRLVVVGT